MRSWWIVGVLALAGTGLFAATRTRAIATTADGDVRVLRVAFGAGYTIPSGRFRPGVGRDTSPTALVVHVERDTASRSTGVLVGACGCRYAADDVLQLPDVAEYAFTFETYPRRDATLRLEFDYLATRTAEFNSPAPIPPPASADGVEDLPVVTRIDGETWVLSPDPQDTRSVVVRAAGADRSGFAWAYRGASFADASGNRVFRQSDGFTTREHRISLPATAAGAGYRLCPHEPWWELAIDLGTTKSMTFRFRPPR
ncbi:MAG: hypothetical protein K8T90_18865 [Planctomycetes bacterium]|nr:hypothetical protein [Planctomycetota bacterium]